MTLSEFRNLNEEKQREFFIKKAVLLGERKTQQYYILLFQLEGFYIEIFSSKKEGEVTLIKTFTTTQELEPYLQAIDISELLN